MLVLAFHEGRVKATLTYRVRTTQSNDRQKEGKLSTHSQIVSSRLAMHATDDVIAEAETDIANSKQAERMSAVRDSEASWEKALPGGRLYEEARSTEFSLKYCMSLIYSRRARFG